MTDLTPKVHRRRVCEPAPIWLPFYTRGKTWRNEIELKERGWYFMDDRKVLSGPYTTKLDCECFMRMTRSPLDFISVAKKHD